MKYRLLAATLCLCAFDLQPSAVDACGVKLAVKAPSPNQIARKTSASVLLLGRAGKLERSLALEGHQVEVASNASAAKRSSYNLIITSSDGADEARARFGDSVVVASGDDSRDLRLAEARVSRRPLRTTERSVVAARSVKTVIAAGPDKRPMDSKPIETKPIEPKPVETKPAVATTEPKRPETKPEPVAKPEPKPEPVAKPKPEPKAKPEPTAKPEPAVAKTTGFPRAEEYFGVSSTTVGSKRSLDKVAAWLQANSSVSILIEGHADPSGSHDDNLTLSKARADAAREYLISTGVDGSRIEVQAFGDTKLKYGARDGRNRRIAIILKP